MSFNVSALTDYTSQNHYPLVTSSVFGSRTVGLMTPQLGVKSSETINIIETDASFQDGSNCGFNALGSTTLSQRKLEVGRIKINESLCPKTLESFYTQSQLPRGSRYDSLPFEELYASKKAGIIAGQLEIAVWQGDLDSPQANLNRFDGLLKIIGSLIGSGVAAASPDGAVTESNVREIIRDIIRRIPAAVIDKEDLRLFMGWDSFRALLNRLTEDNLFHYTMDEAARSGELAYPGSTLRIIAVHGLNGTDSMVAARLSNLYFGTDMMNEEERFEIFFAREADEIRFVCEFKAGVQVAFPTEIVMYLPA